MGHTSNKVNIYGNCSVEARRERNRESAACSHQRIKPTGKEARFWEVYIGFLKAETFWGQKLEKEGDLW